MPLLVNTMEGDDLAGLEESLRSTYVQVSNSETLGSRDAHVMVRAVASTGF